MRVHTPPKPQLWHSLCSPDSQGGLVSTPPLTFAAASAQDPPERVSSAPQQPRGWPPPVSSFPASPETTTSYRSTLETLPFPHWKAVPLAHLPESLPSTSDDGRLPRLSKREMKSLLALWACSSLMFTRPHMRREHEQAIKKHKRKRVKNTCLCPYA